MRRFWIMLTMVVMLVCMASPVAVEAESYQDRYLIAYHTYENTTPNKYKAIYYDVRDGSARQTMIDAGRDYCRNEVQDGRFFGNPDSDRFMDCTSF